MIKYENDILKLVEQLRLIGFCLNRYYSKEYDEYLAYTYYDQRLNIAICNHHNSWYLNSRICVTYNGYSWNKFIISLPIPINYRQLDFIIQKITDLIDSKQVNKITNYNIDVLYNLK